MNEDLMKIFDGVEISEDFKTKVSKVLENQISEAREEIRAEEEAKAEDKYSALAENYSEYVVTEMEDKTEQYINEEVIPQIGKYVDHAASEFMSENKLAVDNGIKVKLAESFLGGLGSIAEQFNVQVPQGAENELDKANQNLAEANQKIDKLLDKQTELEATITESKRSKVFETVSEDMTETKREKLQEMASKVKFIDESQYKGALEDLKESLAPGQENSKEDSDNTLNEQNNQNQPTNSWLDSVMSRV